MLAPVAFAASPAGAATVPDAPAAPTVVPGNGQIVVTFDAPANDGGSAITAYDATCTSSNGGTSHSHGNAGTVTPITVGGLTNGKLYTCTVNATNDEGTSAESDPSSPSVVPATVPDAPDAPTAAEGDQHITVSFIPPVHSGGSAVIGYTVACTDGVNHFLVPGPFSPINVAGLTNGTSYTCTVEAVNGVGASDESLPSAAVIPATVPDAPTATSVALDLTQLDVSFSPPANNGGRAITSYTATCTGAASPVSMSGPTSPIVVDGAKGNTYTCTVTATNLVGTGPASVAAPPVVIPAELPARPERPVLERGNKKVAVTVVPPDSNGSPISSYKATCSGGFVPVSASSSEPRIVVAGLTNGTSYTCKVTATNGVGASPASLASLPAVPAAVPDGPPRPTVVRGIGKIEVRFTRPGNSGSPITGFTATCTSSNGGVLSGSRSGPASPLTVTGLTNGRSYTCKVSAKNALGSGPRSPASVATVPGTAPAAPTIKSLIPGKAPGPTGPLSLAFAPGSNNGTPISTYRATCTPNNGGVSRFALSIGTPIAVPGLLTGRVYTCRVVAISTSGTSGPSAALSAIVGAPAIPKNLTISAKVAHGMTLTFVSPSNNSNAILHFRARCTSTNGGASADQFARGSPFGVNGLTPGGRYSCILTAINGRGEGPAARVGPVRLPF